MDKMLITVEDVKNEIGISIGAELDLQPKQVDRWILRQQRVILNHVARYAYGGMEQVKRMLNDERKLKVIREAIIEHIDYLADNNFVQPNNLMNVNGQQSVEPAIAPLAHQILLNAGLLYTGAWC